MQFVFWYWVIEGIIPNYNRPSLLKCCLFPSHSAKFNFLSLMVSDMEQTLKQSLGVLPAFAHKREKKAILFKWLDSSDQDKSEWKCNWNNLHMCVEYCSRLWKKNAFHVVFYLSRLLKIQARHNLVMPIIVFMLASLIKALVYTMLLKILSFFCFSYWQHVVSTNNWKYSRWAREHFSLLFGLSPSLFFSLIYIDLPPLKKDFYIEDPTVSARSAEEVDAWRCVLISLPLYFLSNKCPFVISRGHYLTRNLFERGPARWPAEVFNMHDKPCFYLKWWCL